MRTLSQLLSAEQQTCVAPGGNSACDITVAAPTRLPKKGTAQRDAAPSGPRACSRFERGLQQAGEFTAGVGTDVTLAGIVTGTAGTVVAAGGAVSGDPPMAAVGTMVMAKGAEMTGVGGTITLVGVGLQMLGGRPRDAVIKLMNDQLAKRLSAVPIVRSYVKEGLKKVEQYIPQFNLCE